MVDAREYVADYIERLRQGDEDAFHALIEADASVLPLLIEQFHKEGNRMTRARIVECIWQHRNPAMVDFLASALLDPVPEVWKQALDGLVAIGGARSIHALQQAKLAPSSLASTPHGITAEWIDEALDQLQAKEST